jgi:hypothetical protein
VVKCCRCTINRNSAVIKRGRVIAIDSSIKRGRYGEILFIENDKKWRGSLSGKVLPLYHQ